MYFPSVTVAADHFQISSRSLVDCLDDKRPTVLGLRWRRADVYGRLRNFFDDNLVSPPTAWRGDEYLVTYKDLLEAYKASLPKRWRPFVTMEGLRLRLADIMLGELFIDGLHWKRRA